MASTKSTCAAPIPMAAGDGWRTKRSDGADREADILYGLRACVALRMDGWMDGWQILGQRRRLPLPCVRDLPAEMRKYSAIPQAWVPKASDQTETEVWAIGQQPDSSSWVACL